jgi:hypothetical protein
MTGENAMTRDEAISIIKNVLYRSVAAEMRTRLRDDIVDSTMDRMAIDEADGLVALGILKLDEPKTFNQKLCDGMKASLGVWLNAGEIERVQESFDAAGLRIVEK